MERLTNILLGIGVFMMVWGIIELLVSDWLWDLVSNIIYG